MSVAVSAMAEIPVATSDSRARAFASGAAWGGICLWVLVAPFEGIRPLIRVPGQSLSSVEAALISVMLLWGTATAMSLQTWSDWRRFGESLYTPVTAPWLTFLAAAFAAAIFAGLEPTNALHMAGRFGLAFGVFLVTVSAMTTQARVVSVLVAGAMAGVVISVLVALEFIGVPFVLHALTAFRPGIAVVGAHVRAAGPFQYPTIASMYLEILFAFVLALLPLAIDRGQIALAAAAAIILAAIAEAITLTFTRSGLGTVASSLLIVGLWRWRAHRFDRAVKAIVGIGVVIAIELLSSHSLDAVRLRMTTEGQDDWYQASIDAPSELAFATGSIATVQVTLTNAGLTTWDSAAEHPYRVSYHWLLADADRAVVYDGLRTSFDAPVAPNATVTAFVQVRAPSQPGHYRLVWDVVQEGLLWFSSEPNAELSVTQATVAGPATAAMTSIPIPMPKAAIRLGRLKLWQAAIRMLGAHPILGVGPDNFRLLYGSYAGVPKADTRVHTNNMYLEILIGAGIAGMCGFLWLFWRAARILSVLARRSVSGDMAMLAAGVTAACAAIAIHGLVDSFFSFTATYTLFAITLGLAVACERLTSTHAHRV